MSNFVLRVWMHDDDEPERFMCPSLAIVAREKARIIQADLDAYDAYAASSPLPRDDDDDDP